MKYKLLPKSGQGILIDRTPILRDIKDTFEVSFLLPSEGDYIALFRGSDKIEYRKTIKDGICKVPHQLLKNEQYVELTVCQMDESGITKAFLCEPLHITALFTAAKSQWQISGGMTEKSAFKRMAELEELYNTVLERLVKLENKITDNEFFLMED